MEGTFLILLSKGDNLYASFSSSHGSGQNLSRVVLVDPDHKFIALSEATFNQTVGESTCIAIKLLESPVEMLLVESDRVKHVVGSYGNLV